MKNLFRIFGFFKEMKWRFLLVLLVGCISIVIFAFMPTYLNNGFNVLRDWIDGAISDPMFSVVKCLIIFGILALFNALFDIFCSFVIISAENKIITKKTCEAKRKLDVVPVSFLQKYTMGDLSRRVSTLTAEIVNEFLNTVYTTVRIVVFFITTAIMMFMIHWILAIVVICSLPICVITARIVSRRTQKYFNAYAKSSIETYTYVDQKFTLKDFYALHGLDSDSTKFDENNKKLTRAMVGEDTATAFNTIYINYIQNFMYLVVTFLFGILYITQVVPTEFGALPAFIMYSNRFLANAVIVTTATNLFQGISAKAPRVFEILDCPDDITENESITIERVRKDIVFDKVTVLQDDEKVLNKVSFTIPQGASVAFAGPSGAGKTHIVNLLGKLNLATSGTIKVDGMDLCEITSKSYYRCVGISMEQPFIFRGTVAENLLYGIRRELPENVMNVTERLRSHGFIDALPNGYETWLSDNASILGAGQMQAIAVARLVLQKPDVAIFHESLSATDAVTEKTVFETVTKMHRKQTTIFVTHRLSSVEHCDTIFYMEKGKIVESGNHADLMAKKGKYYKAYTGE